MWGPNDTTNMWRTLHGPGRKSIKMHMHRKLIKIISSFIPIYLLILKALGLEKQYSFCSIPRYAYFVTEIYVPDLPYNA